nr:serine protease [Neobacillus sp. Marseille-Q6967]
MSFLELEQRSQELLDVIRNINEINGELISRIEDLLPNYAEYYDYFDITNPGQFISQNQAALFMAYSKVHTVPILITTNNRVVANASGLLMQLDRSFLITNYHVLEAWNQLNEESETLFQIGSTSIPVEDLIIDSNRSLDLITISVTNELLESISNISLKKFYSPQNWPIEAEVGTLVVASGFPGALREDGIAFSNLHHGSIVEQITDLTESKYIIPFDRNMWEQVLGVNHLNQITSLGGFSGGPVFSLNISDVDLVGIIFEDGGNFFDGIRVIRSSVINRNGTINTLWGY